jgi:homoserine O-acetyltransferase/O-succinyltransferase
VPGGSSARAFFVSRIAVRGSGFDVTKQRLDVGLEEGHVTVLETPSVEGRGVRGSLLPPYSLVGADDAPVVVVLGGISATRHVVSSSERSGWWGAIAGHGCAIDTNRVRVLGFDFIDGGRDAAGRPRRVVTTGDQAACLDRILRANGIDRVHAIVGSSYGGMVALAFAERFPDQVDRLVVISAAHESHPMSTALRTLQRRIVELGLETNTAAEAMSIARGLAMTTYRTAAEFATRFASEPVAIDGNDARFEVDDYLRDRGRRFAETMPVERFLALSLSGDLHRVDPSRITVPTTLVAAEGDAIVPRQQIEALATQLNAPTKLVHLQTKVGHDAFLVETDKVSAVVTSALQLTH